MTTRDVTQSRPPAAFYLVWYGFVFSLPFTDLVFLPSVFKDSLQFSTILLVLLVVPLLGWMFRSSSLPRVDLTSGLLYAFLMIAALSVLQSNSSPLQEYRGERLWDKGARQVLALAICVGTYWATLAMVRTRVDALKAVAVYVLTLVPATLAGILDVLNFYSPSSIVTDLDHLIHRNVVIAPTQTFGIAVPRLQLLAFEPSMAANYLLTVVPLALALAALSRRRWARLASLSAAFVGAVLLIMTFSLGALAAGGVELFAFVVLAPWVMRPLRVVALAGAAGIVLAISAATLAVPNSPINPSNPSPAEPASAPGISGGRLAGGNQDLSSFWRRIMLETAWNTFVDHPLTGVGWGNSPFYVLQEFPDSGRQHPFAAAWTSPQGESASTVASDNMFVRVLAETGLVGGLVFIGWHLAVALRGVKVLKAGGPVVLGLLVAAAGIVTQYSGLSGLDKRYWFFIPALIVAISVMESHGADELPAIGRWLARREHSTVHAQ